MAVGKITILTPIKWGVMWGIRHPWHTIAGAYLLRAPWSRGLMIDHLILLGRGAIAGTRGSWASILTRVVVPAYAATRPVVIRVATRIGVGASIVAPPVAVGVGVLTVSVVASAGIVWAQQKVGLVGPKAPTMSLGGWLGEEYRDVQLNPFMMGLGTVV